MICTKEIPQTKTCRACGEAKPLAAYSKQCLGRYGVTSRCKSCKKVETAAWQKRNLEKCRLKGLRWRQRNRERFRATCRENYRTNTVARIASVVKYQRKNPSVKRKHDANWRAKNPEKIRIWRTANAALLYAHSAARRAAKRGATPRWLTPEHHAAIRAKYKHATELSRSTGVQHHVDHIYPIKHPILCGLHVPWNLRVITGAENCRKHNRLPEETN